MERNEYDQWEFIRIIWRGEAYIDFDTLVAYSGEKRSTLHRKISQLENIECMNYKNRRLFKLSWALKLHQHLKQHGL